MIISLRDKPCPEHGRTTHIEPVSDVPFAYLTGPLFTIRIPRHPISNAAPTSDADNPEGSPIPPPYSSSDLSSESQYVTFTLHKQLLESLSVEFHKHLTNGMKEGITHTMVIHDVDPDTFGLFARWAYGATYYIPDDRFALRRHIRVIIFAERFNLGPLRALCVRNIEGHLARSEEEITLTLQEAVESFLADLRLMLDNLPFEFAHPESAEKRVQDDIQKLGSVISSLCARRYFVLKKLAVFRELLIEYPEFAVGVMDGMHAHIAKLEKEGPRGDGLEDILRRLEWYCAKCGQPMKQGLDFRSRYFCGHGCGVQAMTLAVTRKWVPDVLHPGAR